MCSLLGTVPRRAAAAHRLPGVSEVGTWELTWLAELASCQEGSTFSGHGWDLLGWKAQKVSLLVGWGFFQSFFSAVAESCLLFPGQSSSLGAACMQPGWCIGQTRRSFRFLSLSQRLRCERLRCFQPTLPQSLMLSFQVLLSSVPLKERK